MTKYKQICKVQFGIQVFKWYQQEGGKNFTIWPWSTWRYWLETRTVDTNAYRWVKCQQPKIKSTSVQTATATATH